MSVNSACKSMHRAFDRSTVAHNTNRVAIDQRSQHDPINGQTTMRSVFRPIALLGLFLIAATAHAQNNYYVDITNNTGYVIHYIYVSPASANTWEEDVLGNDVLMDGESFRVNLNGYNSPIFDIRLVDEDGDTYTYPGVNVTTQFVNVTLADLDVD